MRPNNRYYTGFKKGLVKPVQYAHPLELFDQFVVSVLLTAKPNNPDHVRLVIELMQIYSQSYS